MGIVAGFRRLIGLFNKKEKTNSVIMLGLIILGGLAETIGIGVILPFATILLDQTSVEKYPIIKTITEVPWIGGYRRFIAILCVGLVLIFILKSLYMFFLIYIQNRFTLNRQIDMSRKLFQSYIYKPYEYFFHKNTAELQRNVNVLVGSVIQGMLMTGLSLLTELMVVVCIMVLLLIIDPISSVSIIIVLGGITALYYIFVKKKLNSIAKKQQTYGIGMVKSVNEGLGGIKDVKILQREESFISRYNENGRGFAKTTATYNIISQSPRLLIETVAICGLLIIVVINALRNPDMGASLPTIALFGMAAIRIMPSMNRIVGYMTTVRFSTTHFEMIYDDLKEAGSGSTRRYEEVKKTEFTKNIEIHGLKYRYPGTESVVLENVELTIDKGLSIGIMGSSGAGKTTLIDLLLGLLEPEKGEILIDGKNIMDNLEGYRKNIGYVPQEICIIDDRIAANVAFGVPEDDVDLDKVWAVLRTANLADYIETLEDGLDTKVGESGMRLSGGQRQRLGIARALYDDPDILVLDEATSSLDTESEKAISDAMINVGHAKTMIIIAHRLNTLDKCDAIYEIIDSRIEIADIRMKAADQDTKAGES